jgi:hypothetical protein
MVLMLEHRMDGKTMRRLNRPIEVGVRYNTKGDPTAVQLKPPRGAWKSVTLNRRAWRINQHWWRSEGQQIARTYYEVDPGDGPTFHIFLEEYTGVWYKQQYSPGEPVEPVSHPKPEPKQTTWRKPIRPWR